MLNNDIVIFFDDFHIIISQRIIVFITVDMGDYDDPLLSNMFTFFNIRRQVSKTTHQNNNYITQLKK